MPAQSDLRQRQPVFLARRFPLRWPARFLRSAARPPGAIFRVSYTYSKALDDVERILLQLARSTTSISGRTTAAPTTISATAWCSKARCTPPLGPARTAWEHLSHGFQLTTLSAILLAAAIQHHHRREYHSGNRRRPTINGVFINRNAGSGFDFLNLSARLSRTFQLSERVRLEALAEAFNLTNHMNGVTLNGVFGPGRIPRIRHPRSGRSPPSTIRARCSSPCGSSF